MGWQTGGEVGVQEAEGTIVGVLDDKFPPCKGPIIVGGGVPRLVVGIEVAHHQGVSAEVSLEEGGKVG